MARTQIAQLTPHLYSGGVEERVARIVGGLDARAIETTWIGFGDVNPQLIERAGGAIDVVSAPKVRQSGVDYGLVTLIAQILRRKRVELLHVHNWSTSVYGFAAARLAGVPHVLYGVGGREVAEGADSRRRAIRHSLAPQIDGFTTVCDFLADEIAGDWGVPRTDVRVIRTGVALDKYEGGASRQEARARLGIPQDAIVFGTMGIRRAVKRLDDLIIAGGKIDDPRVHIAIIGGDVDGGYRQLRALGDEVGLGARLHLVLRVEDPHNVLKALDTYVNCSVFEGSSNAIIEAMACGVPVIATAVGGSPELVTAGHNGLLVPPEDVDALAAAIRKLAADAPAREVFGQRSGARARADHGVERMCAAYAELYDELINSSSRSRLQRGLQSVSRLAQAWLR